MTQKIRPPRSIDGKYRVNKTMGVDPYFWVAFTEHVERQRRLTGVKSLSNGNCFETTFKQFHPEIAQRMEELKRENQHDKKKLGSQAQG